LNLIGNVWINFGAGAGYLAFCVIFFFANR